MWKPRIIIVGASGHGKVVLDALMAEALFQVEGFVDSLREPGQTVLGLPILGREEDLPELIRQRNIEACAIGEGCGHRRELALRRVLAIAPGLVFPAVIHPAAVVSRHAEIGDGALLCAHSTAGPGSRVGRFSVLHAGGSLEADGRLDDFATLSVGTGPVCDVTDREPCEHFPQARLSPPSDLKRLVIVGAGAFGREVYEWAGQCRENGRWWRVAGFLDDDPAALHGYADLPPLLGPIRDYVPGPKDLLVCAIGSTPARKRVVTELLGRGARFTCLVHSSTRIGRNVRLGLGCLICPGVTLTCDIRMGDFVTVNVGSSVGHNTVLGDWVTLSGHCDVTGYSQLGEEVFLGSHASILPRVQVGKRAVVGAGCVAVINVPPGATLAQRSSFRLDSFSPQDGTPATERTANQLAAPPLNPMVKKTILISSAGRRSQLIKCFREDALELGIDLRVLATDLNPEMSPAAHLADQRFAVPRCGDPTFVATLLKLCEEEKVDLLIPTIDPELAVLAASKHLFAALGTRVVVSDPEIVALAGDKALTALRLAEAGVDTPVTVSFGAFRKDPSVLTWPVIVKPKGGSASVGISRPLNIADLAQIHDRGDLIVQECLQGVEYTVNLFFASDGTFTCAIPHLRLEVRSGEVSKGRTERHGPLLQIAEKVAASLKGACGPLCFQAIVTRENRASVFEINARFGGGYPLAHRAGAKFSKWLLEETCAMPSTASADWKEAITMLRYDEAVFIND